MARYDEALARLSKTARLEAARESSVGPGTDEPAKIASVSEAASAPAATGDSEEPPAPSEPRGETPKGHFAAELEKPPYNVPRAALEEFRGRLADVDTHDPSALSQALAAVSASVKDADILRASIASLIKLNYAWIGEERRHPDSAVSSFTRSALEASRATRVPALDSDASSARP